MNNTVHLTVVRHGETQWNAERRMQGHLNPALNEKGRRQCVEAAQRLAERHFDLVYASDLERTMETARALVKGRGLSINPDSALREWCLGDLQGLTIDEAGKKFPDVIAQLKHLKPGLKIPGGEPYVDFYNRSVNALQALAVNHPNQRILVVTHGGLMNNLLHHVRKVPMEQRRKIHLSNLCVITLELKPDDEWVQWTLLDGPT